MLVSAKHVIQHLPSTFLEKFIQIDFDGTTPAKLAKCRDERKLRDVDDEQHSATSWGRHPAQCPGAGSQPVLDILVMLRQTELFHLHTRTWGAVHTQAEQNRHGEITSRSLWRRNCDGIRVNFSWDYVLRWHEHKNREKEFKWSSLKYNFYFETEIIAPQKGKTSENEMSHAGICVTDLGDAGKTGAQNPMIPPLGTK